MRRRTEEKRQQIMQAAAVLFAAKGDASTTLDDVARSIRASKVTIYGYFASKEALLKAILFEGYAPVKEALVKSLTGDTLAERLRNFCRQQLRLACMDHAIPMARLIIAEVDRSEIGDLLASGTELEAWSLVEAEFDLAIKAGDVRGMTAAEMTRWLKAIIRGDLFCAMLVGETRRADERGIVEAADGAVAIVLAVCHYSGIDEAR